MGWYESNTRELFGNHAAGALDADSKGSEATAQEGRHRCNRFVEMAS